HRGETFARKHMFFPPSPPKNTPGAPPKEFIYDRLAHPPATFRQEKLKNDVRLPPAREFIKKNKLNEIFEGKEKVGLIVQGGLYNGLQRALGLMGLGDQFGACPLPTLVLNVVY